MGDVVKLGTKGSQKTGKEAVDQIVNFLREQANKIETGECRPVHKIIIVTYEEDIEGFTINSAFSNANTLERCGMLSVAMNDIMNPDDDCDD